MTVIAIKKAFSLAMLWCKQHIELFLGAAIVLVGTLTFARGQKIDLSKILKNFNEKHAEEKKIVEESYKKEENSIVDASVKMKDAVVEIEKKKDDDLQSLDDKKSKEKEKLLKDSERNPDELTKKLSELTGFKIDEGDK